MNKNNSLFNYDKYFETISNQRYKEYIDFHKDRKALLEDIIYEIQTTMDNAKREETVMYIYIYIKPTRYPTIFFPTFMETIPLSYTPKPSHLGFSYEIPVTLEDLKNIENKYNEIVQEKILSKEEFFNEHSKELLVKAEM